MRQGKTTGSDTKTMTKITPEAEGLEMASAYVARQHWKMKWVTLLISGLMTTYTIQTHTWILEIAFLPWVGLMGAIATTQWHIIKLFIEHVKHMRVGNEHPLPSVMKAISQHTWIQWGVALMVWYWIFTMGYISWFAEIPAGT
jgi:hypothetical protein